MTHQLQINMFVLHVTVKCFLRLYVADGRGVVGANRRAADCVAHCLSGREGGTAPAQRHGGWVASKDGHVIRWRRGRWYLVSCGWKMADGMNFFIMSQLWYRFKTRVMNCGHCCTYTNIPACWLFGLSDIHLQLDWQPESWRDTFSLDLEDK